VDGATGDRRVIATGRRAIVYLQFALDQAPPKRIRHRIEFDIQADTGPVPAAFVGADVDVATQEALVLGPPLSGGPWVAVYDPALENGHRQYVYAVGGKARIPGRFAIDWMKPGAPARSSTDVSPASAGASVLAVADAVVVGLRDGVAEVAPGQPRPPLALADATGNYVALDLGAGRYAFYEHLEPGLSVKLGSRVRRGQVIGRVGSTGQASRPHLHFHVADANSPLGAEGKPYRLVGARIVGAYPSITAFEAGGPWKRTVDRPRGPALPPPNSVVMFDPADVP
jgi:murein DD-endopeptidase MepM/ murein hydrolase activator NlpD